MDCRLRSWPVCLAKSLSRPDITWKPWSPSATSTTPPPPAPAQHSASCLSSHRRRPHLSSPPPPTYSAPPSKQSIPTSCHPKQLLKRCIVCEGCYPQTGREAPRGTSHACYLSENRPSSKNS